MVWRNKVVMALLTVGAMSVALPYAAGIRIEQRVRDFERSMQAQQAPYRVESFERGVFSSKFKISISLAPIWAELPPEERAKKPQSLVILNDVRHGPLLMGPDGVAMGWSRINSQLELDEETRGKLRPVFGEAAPFMATSLVDVAGRVAMHVHTAHGRLERDDVKLVLQPSDAHIRLDDGRTIKGEWQWPGMTLEEPSGRRLELNGVRSTSDMVMVAPELWPGRFTVALDHIEMSTPDQPSLGLDRLAIDASSTMPNDHLMDVRYQFGVGRVLSMGQTAAEDVALDVAVKGLHIEKFVYLQSLIRQGEKQSHDEASRRALLEGASALLNEGLALDISRMHAVVNAQTLDVSLGLQLPPGAVANADTLPNLRAALSGSADVSLPEGLLHGRMDERALEAWLAHGMVKREGELIKTHVVVDKGSISMNDQLLPL